MFCVVCEIVSVPVPLDELLMVSFGYGCFDSSAWFAFDPILERSFTFVRPDEVGRPRNLSHSVSSFPSIPKAAWIVAFVVHS